MAVSYFFKKLKLHLRPPSPFLSWISLPFFLVSIFLNPGPLRISLLLVGWTILLTNMFLLTRQVKQDRLSPEEKFKKKFSPSEWEEFNEIVLKETGLNDLDYSLGLMHFDDRMNPWVIHNSQINPCSEIFLKKESPPPIKVKEFKRFTLRLEDHKLVLYPK